MCCWRLRRQREGEKEKFRLINVAWNSFRSNRNCVLFCSFHSHDDVAIVYALHPCYYSCFCVVVVFCIKMVDAQDIPLSGLSISENPSICSCSIVSACVCVFGLFHFALCTLPITKRMAAERKLQILYGTCTASIVHRLNAKMIDV